MGREQQPRTIRVRRPPQQRQQALARQRQQPQQHTITLHQQPTYPSTSAPQDYIAIKLDGDVRATGKYSQQTVEHTPTGYIVRHWGLRTKPRAGGYENEPYVKQYKRYDKDGVLLERQEWRIKHNHQKYLKEHDKYRREGNVVYHVYSKHKGHLGKKQVYERLTTPTKSYRITTDSTGTYDAPKQKRKQQLAAGQKYHTTYSNYKKHLQHLRERDKDRLQEYARQQYKLTKEGTHAYLGVPHLRQLTRQEPQRWDYPKLIYSPTKKYGRDYPLWDYRAWTTPAYHQQLSGPLTPAQVTHLTTTKKRHQLPFYQWDPREVYNRDIASRSSHLLPPTLSRDRFLHRTLAQDLTAFSKETRLGGVLTEGGRQFYTHGKNIFRETPLALHHLLASEEQKRQKYLRQLRTATTEHQRDKIYRQLLKEPRLHQKYPYGTQGLALIGVAGGMYAYPSLIGKPFIYGSGALSAYDAWKGTQAYLYGDYSTAARRGSQASMEFIPAAGATLRGVHRFAGLRQPLMRITSDFPKQLRTLTSERLKKAHGQRITGLHAETSPRIYAGVEDRGKILSYGMPGTYYTPAITTIRGRPIYTGGDIFLNPLRNPTSYRHNLLRLLQKRSTLPFYKWQKTRPHWIIGEQKVHARQQTPQTFHDTYQQSIRKGEDTTTFAPKTVAGSTQPELESFTTTRPYGYTEFRVGSDAAGTPIYHRFKNTGNWARDLRKKIKLKAAYLKQSYSHQLKEQNDYSTYISRRGHEKWNILKQQQGRSPYDNSGTDHSNAVQHYIRQQEQQYNLNVDNKVGKAFAELHDIYKENLYNRDINADIAHGITKGKYNYIPSVRTLTKKQKRVLAKTIYADERPPFNIHNVLHRTEPTLLLAKRRLTNQQKLYINADRLARFGKDADPHMLYKIRGQKPQPNTYVKRTSTKPKKHTDYETSYYRRESGYKVPYGRYQTTYKKMYPTHYPTTYPPRYGTHYPYSHVAPYPTPYSHHYPNSYKPPYQPPRYPSTPPYTKTYPSTYTPPGITPQYTTYTGGYPPQPPPPKTTHKLPSPEQQHTAYSLLTKENGEWKPQGHYADIEAAESYGRDYVDTHPTHSFTIEKIKTQQRNIRHYRSTKRNSHKFTKRGRIYLEKPRYRNDHNGEFMFKALRA